MRIPWSKLIPIAKAIYGAFLRGRTVRLPGGGTFTLPSERPTVPGAGSPFDMPHVPGPVAIRPLVSASAAKEAEGKATPIYGPTAGVILFIIFGLPVVALVLAGVWEARTLASPLKGDHITAQLRALFFKAPGAVALALTVWWAFLAAVTLGVLAHAWF